MVQKIALGGEWSNASSWQDGVIPTSGSTVSVSIAPGVTSVANLGQRTETPFVVGSISFERNAFAPSTLDVTNGTSDFFDSAYLQVGDLYGGGWSNQNQVVVGTTNYVTGGSRTSTLEVTHNASNVNFTLTGFESSRADGNAELVIGNRFAGSSFSFDGKGFQETLELGHPPMRFIANEIDLVAFGSPSPEFPWQGSGTERIELAGVHFDRADFIPYGAVGANETATGAVLLSDHGMPQYALLNVHVAGYGGATGGHFSVGTDQTTNLNYVQYSH